MKSTIFAIFIVVSLNVFAEDFSYKKYSFPPFQHLEFDVVENWIPVQNNLEVVFTDKNYSLPQLFFQAVGKTDKFNSPSSFLEFLKSEEPKDHYRNIKHTQSSGYPSISYGYFELGAPHIYVHSLIVDVGEGILWFYLKVPKSEEGDSHPIIKRLSSSIDFK